MQNGFPEQIMDSLVPQLMEAVVEVAPQERVQNRTQEQIADIPVPQIMEAVVEVLPSTPQERVLNRTQEQIADTPVPQIMEAVVEVFPPTPQVRVQSRIQEQIMDLPVPQIMAASKPYTGKVFTVEMHHQHVHQAYPGNYVVFNIKGLDKRNMPRSGDVMVPASQIQEQIVDVGGTGIVREILEEKVVERIQDPAAFCGTEPRQSSTRCRQTCTCDSAGSNRGVSACRSGQGCRCAWRDAMTCAIVQTVLDVDVPVDHAPTGARFPADSPQMQFLGQGF